MILKSSKLNNWSLLVWLVVLGFLILVFNSNTAVADNPLNSNILFQSENINAGINFSHKKTSSYFAVGQAWGDYNNDGHLDLYLTDQIKNNILYHNNGDGTFGVSPISSQVGLGTYNLKSGGASFADYDNDGDQDLIVLGFGPDALMRNDLIETGSPGFTNVTASAGVGLDDLRKGETAAWGDYDKDGDLDLYIANWYCRDNIDPCDVTPTAFDGSADKLYRNNGDGTFTDVSYLFDYPDLLGSGFVGSFVDYDNDGDLDIYVINDMQANPIGNKLFRNDGPGSECGLPAGDWCFEEVAAAVGANTVLCGMGLAIGDYDNDLDLDFYFSNAPSCGDGIHHFLENQTSQGSPTFIDRSIDAGVGIGGVGWGTFFSDFNNNGFLDLFLSRTGNVGNPPGEDYYSVVFGNNGDGTFANLGGLTGMEEIAAGSAYADYNRDGLMDVVSGPFDGPFNLYQNTSTTLQNLWISVRLIGSPANGVNADGIGARLYIRTNDGVIRMQEVKSGSSLGAGNQTALHFGLDLSESIRAIRVVWPNGLRQTYHGSLELNRHYVWGFDQLPQLETVDEPPPLPSETGFLDPTADSPANGGDGDGFETNPLNAYSDDGLFAIDMNSGSNKQVSCTAVTKDKHDFSDFSFGLPTNATVQGIEVRLDGYSDALTGRPLFCVQLSSDGGTTWTNAQTTGPLTTSESTFILGSPTDLWDHTWTADGLDNDNFQVRVISVAANVLRDFYLDWLAVNVYYQ